MPDLPPADHAPFTYSFGVRYLEVDQQGVVFNMWYLAYADDAMTAYLHHRGLPYLDMIGAGHDLHVVHTELDWTGPLSFGQPAQVEVALARRGRTSFTLQFRFRSEEREVARASTVYVTVATDGSGKVQIPDYLTEALGPLAPLWEP